MTTETALWPTHAHMCTHTHIPRVVLVRHIKPPVPRDIACMAAVSHVLQYVAERREAISILGVLTL